MSKKKQSASQEARERLSEKIVVVQSKSQKLTDFIHKISAESVCRAQEVLAEKSKSKFMSKYVSVSAELEGCINQLLLVSDAISSLDKSDDDSSEGSDEDAEDTDIDCDIRSVASITTVGTMCMTAATDQTEHCRTRNNSLESLDSVVEAGTVRDCSPNVAHVENVIVEESAVRNDSYSNLQTPTGSMVNGEENSGSVPVSVSTTPVNTGTPHKGDVVLDSLEETFCLLNDAIVADFPWEEHKAYPVIVANISTPWCFCLQLVDPEYPLLVNQLHSIFLEEAQRGTSVPSGITYVPPVNTFCCAKSPRDSCWYRGKITCIVSEPKDDIKFVVIEQVTVMVFFIDEGYEEVVLLEHIRPLSNEFAYKLPAQSCKCILGGIQPTQAYETNRTDLSFSECNKMWTTESVKFFEKFVRSKDICSAYFWQPPPGAHDPPYNVSLDTVVCDLYIVHPTVSKVHWWKKKTDDNILPITDNVAFQMILNSMAATCPFFISEMTQEHSLAVLISQKLSKVQGNGGESQLTQSNPMVESKKDKPLNPVIVNEEKNEHCQKDASIVVEDEKKTIPAPSSLAAHEEEAEDDVEAKLNEISRILHESRRGDSLKAPRQRSPVSPVATTSLWETNEKHVADNNRTTQIKQVSLNESQPKTHSKEFFPKKTSSKEFFPTKKACTESKTAIIDINQIELQNHSAPLIPEYTTSSFCNVIPEPRMPAKEFSQILVSHVENPGLFYVHLVTKEFVDALDTLYQDINLDYSTKKDDIATYCRQECRDYDVGNSVVVLCTTESSTGEWLRASVVSVRKEGDKKEYQVLYVDYGGTNWVTGEFILPILRKFCALPMLSIACSLADLKPLSKVVTKQCTETPESPDADGGWCEASTARLKQLIPTKSAFLISLKTKAKNSEGCYEVHIYDTSDNKDVFINQLMVDEGFASSDVLSKQLPLTNSSNIADEADELVEALDAWDPMKEEYQSNRNAYNVDTDDPGVAALGVVQPKKGICRTWQLRGSCYRGPSCKFAHAMEGDPVLDQVEVYCDNTILDLPNANRCVPVAIRGVVNPTNFWVNFPYGLEWGKNDGEEESDECCGDEALSQLHQHMNSFYSKKYSKKSDLSILAEGELIAARFGEDDQWYRARVVNTAEDLVQVFYVDYGNTEVITENKIRKLEPDFLHLPFQAVECFLFNTYIEEEVTKDEEKLTLMTEKFRDMVADRLLMAYVVSSSLNKSLVVMLYDTEKEPHLYINETVRSWDGMVVKDGSDVALKDSLMQNSNNGKTHKCCHPLDSKTSSGRTPDEVSHDGVRRSISYNSLSSINSTDDQFRCRVKPSVPSVSSASRVDSLMAATTTTTTTTKAATVSLSAVIPSNTTLSALPVTTSTVSLISNAIPPPLMAVHVSVPPTKTKSSAEAQEVSLRVTRVNIRECGMSKYSIASTQEDDSFNAQKVSSKPYPEVTKILEAPKNFLDEPSKIVEMEKKCLDEDLKIVELEKDGRVKEKPKDHGSVTPVWKYGHGSYFVQPSHHGQAAYPLYHAPPQYLVPMAPFVAQPMNYPQSSSRKGNCPINYVPSTFFQPIYQPIAYPVVAPGDPTYFSHRPQMIETLPHSPYQIAPPTQT